MKDRQKCTRARIAALVLAILSAVLITVSFFTPPMWIIDSSVFVAVGELMAWGALFALWEAIDRGIDAKLTHGDTTISIDGNRDGKME